MKIRIITKDKKGNVSNDITTETDNITINTSDCDISIQDVSK